MAQSTSKREQFNLRVSPQQRDRIDQAAAILGRSRTDFVLESAVREAERVLLDQRLLVLSPNAFDQLERLLDTPPAPTQELRALFAEPPPWE